MIMGKSKLTVVNSVKVGILTGGGDAPGLNSSIRAAVKKCEKLGYEIIGIRYGWAGLLELDTVKLKYKDLKDIIHKGGTILKTSRTNPTKISGGIEKAEQNFKKLGLDALIAIGGDDTLSVADALSKAGLNVVGIPKTIDHDVPETEFTIGFDTAINLAMRTIENLQDTAESHDRIFVVEIMGRNAGWIALYSGLAAGADLILIPEEPFSIKEVINFVNKKIKNEGSQSIIIVVAEGAMIKDYEGPVTKDTSVDQFGHVRLGGIGEFLAKEIGKATGAETRVAVPAHVIRGGPPTALDRIIPTRFGLAAVDLIRQGKYGYMVALKAGKMVPVPLAKATAKTEIVEKELYEEAKTFFD
jgi:6-phosphofructokinase 1